MIRTHFDFYGDLATSESDSTRASGRYAIQRDGQRLIVRDVLSKLRPHPTDTLLDIGCGVGNLLIPLSFLVQRVVGVDHPSVIKRLQDRITADNIELVAGNFLDVKVDDTFGRILIYGVMPALPDELTVFRIIDKALDHLRSDGRMLIGDVNNRDKKRRFQQSSQGQAFEEAWKKRLHGEPNLDVPQADQPSVDVTDEFVARLILHIRTKGYHAYVVEQPIDLPFGRTREDILVVGAEHEGASLLAAY